MPPCPARRTLIINRRPSGQRETPHQRDAASPMHVTHLADQIIATRFVLGPAIPA